MASFSGLISNCTGLSDRCLLSIVLNKHLGRYGLTLHPDKTRLVDFRPKRRRGARHPETDGTSFDFLGLTHVSGRSRNGKNMVRQTGMPARWPQLLPGAGNKKAVAGGPGLR
jgi:hypothetical protein